MSLSGKALGFRLLIGNTIALFLIFTVLGTANEMTYNVNLPQQINGTPEYNPESAQISGWRPPTTGISVLDWLLVFYFTMSYALALWLLFNPISG